MRSKIFSALGVCYSLAAIAFTQQPVIPPANTSPAATGATPPTATPKSLAPPGPAPALTREEQLDLENATLEMKLASAEYNGYIAAIDLEHPGWTYQPQLGRFVYTGQQAPGAPVRERAAPAAGGVAR